MGKPYPTDSGPLDNLADRKDTQRLLVIERKRGRASDKVVGQILRYRGYVEEKLVPKRNNFRLAIRNEL